MSAGRATAETIQGATRVPDVSAEQVSKAPPDAVFGLLTDPRAHLEWAGSRLKGERLTALEASASRALPGSSWTSTGRTSFGEFHDRSVVTRVEQPRLFEFSTDAVHQFRNGRIVRATYIHRYELEPLDGGTRITYRVQCPSGATGLPWYIKAAYTIAPIRAVVLPMMVNEMVRPGLRALAGMAEESA